MEQKEVLEKAKKEAIELSSLTKEFMYGMMWLYVDENNNTFSGWVKESYHDKNFKTLGYLKNGLKKKGHGLAGIKMEILNSSRDGKKVIIMEFSMFGMIMEMYR